MKSLWAFEIVACSQVYLLNHQRDWFARRIPEHIQSEEFAFQDPFMTWQGSKAARKELPDDFSRRYAASRRNRLPAPMIETKGKVQCLLQALVIQLHAAMQLALSLVCPPDHDA